MAGRGQYFLGARYGMTGRGDEAMGVPDAHVQ